MKLDIIKYNKEMGSLITDLNEWWTDVTSATEYNHSLYFKKIESFIDRLEGLRDRRTIKIKRSR